MSCSQVGNHWFKMLNVLDEGWLTVSTVCPVIWQCIWRKWRGHFLWESWTPLLFLAFVWPNSICACSNTPKTVGKTHTGNSGLETWLTSELVIWLFGGLILLLSPQTDSHRVYSHPVTAAKYSCNTCDEWIYLYRSLNGLTFQISAEITVNHTMLYGCVTVQRDLLFIYDKDAVVLGGDAWHRVLTGHLSLIVTGGKDRGRDRQKGEKRQKRGGLEFSNHWKNTKFKTRRTQFMSK